MQKTIKPATTPVRKPMPIEAKHMPNGAPIELSLFE
jgi:hypothetical protein